MSTVGAPASPFRGLSAFGDSDLDALLFFGRARETEVIAANLQASRLTVLYGPTGVGKSSILRAGVAHRLRREVDVVVEILDTWSGDAARRLRGVVEGRPVDSDLYVILDQFEEYFVYHADDTELPRVLADVVDERGLRVNVLIGIRDDSLARLDAFRAPVPNLLVNRLRLERLDRDAARAAILGPIDRFNRMTGSTVEAEPALVGAVLDEVAVGRVELARQGRGAADVDAGGDRVEAPYLQLVLERLWEAERDAGSNVLRVETLKRLGGSARIVHDHLERAMTSLTVDEQQAAAAMYHHLVTPSGMKVAHRVGDLARYAAVDEREASAVLHKLAHERIVRASSENGPASARYEIFHDVLADAVLAWRSRHEEQRALRRAHDARRRARIVAAAALLGLVVVAAVAVFALVERSHARTHAREARAQAFASDALANLDRDPTASVRFALAAAALQPRLHAEEVLRNALTKDRERAVLRSGARVRVARFDESGRRVLVAGDDGKARIYGRTGRRLATYDHGASVTAAAFAPHGRLVATGGRDGTVRLWRDGHGAGTLAAGDEVRVVAFDRSGRRLYAVSSRGTIRAWRIEGMRRIADVQTDVHAVGATVASSGRYVALFAHNRFVRVYALPSGRLVRRLAQKGYIGNVEFSPDEQLLLTTGNEGTVRLWRVPSWQLARELRGPGAAVVAGVFSHDGRLIAAASADGTARVWETATGFQRSVMIGHTSALTSVAFDPTSTAVVTASSDGTARVWDIGGRPVSVLAAHGASVSAATFSPDGRSVVTAGDDGTARLWDPGSEPELRRVPSRRVVDVALTRDGERFATAGDGVVVWSTAPARPLRRLSSVPTTLVAISPGGNRVAAALAQPHDVVVFDARTANVVNRLHASRVVRAVAFRPDGTVLAAAGRSIAVSRNGRLTSVREAARVNGIAVSADGKLVATAGDDGNVRIRDARTWALRRTLRGHRAAVASVRFSVDGTELVSAGRDEEVRIWDVATGHLRRALHWHFGPVADAVLSSDGRWVLTAGPTTAGIGLAHRGELFRPGAYLRGPSRPLTAVGFGGPDGRTVVAASKDGVLRMFRCDVCGDVHDLIAIARRRVAGRG